MNAPVVVKLWGERVGALLWDSTSGYATFEYDKEFVKSGLEVSPLMVPLSNKIYQFPTLKSTKTFQGLPGFIADSLPEKYGNRLLDTFLARHGKKLQDLTPLERLCYISTRGMGALEYEPDFETRKLNTPIHFEVSDLVELAQSALNEGEAFNRARLKNR
ncbi:HipA N-terminal domain-containing protein [Leptospira sp. GIMC2001]|uniref:HipA N-terminal domain-containing protein n=1 Tax=Leptospira sp. GIMC2001 TaxID=1513297 RepID=UPI00234B25A9|nr:HipA N-terminal domain-containing protein [Leptospira sp. GIMC2001]WCL51000.1 HipA N-terminal domain-containing protein [Leptospira sp. GIMC2001]